jgi:hypothetical protein
MTVQCPSGHRSETADYCDQCGARIDGVPTDFAPQAAYMSPASPKSAGDPGVSSLADDLDTSPSARREEACPACGVPRAGDDRYCEGCGYDFLAPPPAAVTWEAVVSADRAQFDRFAAPGVPFPVDYVQRRFGLVEGENRIGRGHGQPDERAPEIDLAGAPADPGISRVHAVIDRRGDGTCVLRDLGSTNGTAVNDDPAPIAPQTDVPLADGDRIRLGAWTTITVCRR